MRIPLIQKVVRLSLIFILSMNTGLLCAQIHDAKLNGIKPDIILHKAETAYHDYKFSIAAGYYETYLKDPSNLYKEVLLKLADCYWQMRKYDQALPVYEILYPGGIQGSSQKDQLRIAELYARKGKYAQASKWLKGVDGYASKTTAYSEKETLKAMKKDSLNWKLGFLNINTSYREYSPFLINNMLFFSSNKPLSIKTKAFGWDDANYARLWEIPLFNVGELPQDQLRDSTFTKKHSKDKTEKIAGIYECGDILHWERANERFIKKTYLKADSNSIGSVVRGFDKIFLNAGTISMDNYNHIYFSANYPKADKNNINRICLMEGDYASEGVTSIQRLPFGDPDKYSVMHPAINGDGTLLVFCSDKADGQGGYDLYYSRRSGINQPWDSITAFRKNINTLGNEVFPAITPNGYLYFSSDQRPGLGGLDIFRIPLKDALAGKGVPEHLSYPVNSSSDDFGWSQQDSTGMKGYFTSDRLNNDDNIYSAAFIPTVVAKHPRKSYFEGFVLGKQSRKPVKGATVFLLDIKEDSVYIAKTDSKGKYRIPVLNSGNVVIKAVDKRYPKSNSLSAKIFFVSQPKDTIQKAPHDILLDELKIGYVWRLSNIQYDFNKWSIPANALPILDSLVKVMMDQPIMIELGSHTDSRGASRQNVILSQHRAETAAAYLVNKGIDPNRIIPKGYGESRLLNRCADGVPCTEEEHQVNRRTEVKVTGYTVKQKETDNIDPDLFSEGDKISKNLFPKGFFTDTK